MRINELRTSMRNRVDIETLWNFHVVDSGKVTADLLLALGSHDVRVADRAADLYLSCHAAPLVVVSGGAGKVTHEEFDLPEAEIYAERLRAAGVPDHAVLVETKATNTGDNFAFSRRLLERVGIKVDSGIIVCKPYMARRSLAAAQKKWPEIAWFVRPPKIRLWDYPTTDVPLARMINLMVGDLQRLDVYARQGFQVSVEIPQHVREAYDRLVESGFDEFVIT